MDKHDIAHYLVGAAAIILGGTAIVVPHKIAPPIEVASSLTEVLKTIPTHAVSVFCIPTMCETADQMADYFERAAWPVDVSTALDANSGVGVRGSSMLCAAISAAIGRAAKCDPVVDDAKWQIWIGKPERATRK